MILNEAAILKNDLKYVVADLLNLSRGPFLMFLTYAIHSCYVNIKAEIIMLAMGAEKLRHVAVNSDLRTVNNHIIGKSYFKEKFYLKL